MIEKRQYTCGCWEVWNTDENTGGAWFCAGESAGNGTCEREKVQLNDWLERQVSTVGVTAEDIRAAVEDAKRLGVVVVVDSTEHPLVVEGESPEGGLREAPLFGRNRTPKTEDEKARTKRAFREGYDRVRWADPGEQ